MVVTLLPVALGLLGCRSSDYALTASPHVLSLEVTSPSYGLFLGEESAVVTGKVAPLSASVLVDGVAVQLAEDGSFTTTLPMDGLDYRMIEVEATLASQYARERIPVFSGTNPSESWPGEATARLTGAGLDKLGEAVGGIVDATGWDTMISDAIPSLDTDYVDIYATGVTHDPTVAYLEPSEDGIAAQVVMGNVSLGVEINALDGWIVIPIEIGFEQILADVMLTPELDDEGLLSLVISEAAIDIGKAAFELGSLDGWLLELIVDAISSFIEPLSTLLLDWLLEEYGVIELGGPLAFETDLLGTSLAAQLSSLWTDDQGLGAGLGIGINESAHEGAPSIPTPGETDGLDGAHASLALHEGAFQLLLEDALISLLADLDLGGMFGDIIGAGIEGLPGGDDAPSGDGWCVALDPGDAYVVRMKESILPVAQLHMPDFRFEAGVEQGGDCEDWLEASLEVTINLGLEGGTALDLGVEVPGGALLYYGADPESYTEDEVVAGLGEYMGTMIGLAGGFLDFDLDSLLGDLAGSGAEGDPLSAVFANLDVEITDSRKLYNDDGTWTEGLYVLSLNLFAEE